MPPVTDLHRFGQRGADGLPVGPGAVTGDDLDAGMGPEPVLDDTGGAALDHVDAPAGLGIDKDRRVNKAPPQGKIVDLSGVRINVWQVFAGGYVHDGVRNVVRRC